MSLQFSDVGQHVLCFFFRRNEDRLGLVHVLPIEHTSEHVPAFLKALSPLLELFVPFDELRVCLGVLAAALDGIGDGRMGCGLGAVVSR